MRRIILRRFQRRISSRGKRFGVCSLHSLNTNTLRARFPEQRPAKRSNQVEKLSRNVGTKIASTNRQRMTLIGIVSISLADMKRRGRTKVAPLFEPWGKRNGL